MTLNIDSQKRSGSVPKTGYVGRFAPSPTGPLHFGSLIAATASYLQAMSHQGQWHVRIDDLDGPRCDDKWNDNILRTLSIYGFEWHGEVMYQSQRRDAYAAAIQQLIAEQSVFNCDCSRRSLNKTASRGDSGIIYPGHCRSKLSTPDNYSGDHALRVNVSDQKISFNDGWQGLQHRDLGKEDGDFVVWRRDNLPAYQLAVVVDDATIGVTESVRGIDLLGSTPKQLFLQQQLGLTTPTYRHVGIAVNNDRQKISKLTNAPALSVESPATMLFLALRTLKQNPPTDLQKWPIAECWQWAINNWQCDNLNRLTQMVIDNPELSGLPDDS